ncbi:hypothetical protein CK203_014405 [Vitis vinifera]|uniref:Uncharacterized protein n=1 Tax=Vitis vinifera TaxID=29760 RepID=A0A438K589_VITVI|nr:hypothetical protein CK203_014405 [Vitis vinifera]
MHGLRLDHPLKVPLQPLKGEHIVEQSLHTTNKGHQETIFLHCSLRYEEPICRTDKVDTMKNMMTQHWQKAPNFVHGIRELSPVAPWLGSRAPSKALWHLSLARGQAPCKAPWHLGLARGRAPCKTSCHLGLARGHQARPRGTLAWLAGTMQGPVARVMARAVAPSRVFVTIGCKISETVKGKLSLGARILQLGGVKRVFKQTSTRREAVEDFPMLFIDSWPYRWPPLRGLHFPVRDQSNSILQIANWLNSITRPQSH